MPVAAGSKPAFRCRNCGHLVGPEAAGERLTPTVCPACNRGATFAANGQKTFQPENWEVLADATPARLAELGLTIEGVAIHTPLSRSVSIEKDMQMCKANLAALEQKRQNWQANKEKIVQEFDELNVKLDALDHQIEAAMQDVPRWEKLTNERERVYQRLQDLSNMEPSNRDAAYQSHLESKLKEYEAVLAGQGSASPQTLKVQARDGVRGRDRA